jgi:hypothetical protein
MFTLRPDHRRFAVLDVAALAVQVGSGEKIG